MLASQQMEAIALAISAALGGGKKETYVNAAPPTSAEALQSGLAALMKGL